MSKTPKKIIFSWPLLWALQETCPPKERTRNLHKLNYIVNKIFMARRRSVDQAL